MAEDDTEILLLPTRLWRLMTEVWPNDDAYQQPTERVLPVAVLERNA